MRALANRLETAGWQFRLHEATLPPQELVAMRLNALLLDPAALGAQGWSYLERVCGELPALGVVVCTGQSTVAQRVRGLRLGADDWVTKPCHPEEVMARIEAVTRRRRRATTQAPAGPTVVGELEVRADQFQAFVGGRSLDLTRREFELLQLLVEARGQVLQREEIYQRVWGYAMVHGDRSVDVFVRKLRLKIERLSPAWRYIHTHFGVGYRFHPERVEGGGSGPEAGAEAGDHRDREAIPDRPRTDDPGTGLGDAPPAGAAEAAVGDPPSAGRAALRSPSYA